MNLSEKKCAPCEGGTPPLTKEEFSQYLDHVPQWTANGVHDIERNFKFKNFKIAVTFINKVAEIAEKEGHHPDIFLHHYKEVRIMLTTHAIGGVSENDFIVAAKIDSFYTRVALRTKIDAEHKT